MVEQEKEQTPQASKGMDADFFFNVYAPAVASGSKEGAEFIRRAFEQGALSYDPNLPENQNPVSPYDTLLKVDLNELEALANMPLFTKSTSEGLISQLLRKISTFLSSR